MKMLNVKVKRLDANVVMEFGWADFIPSEREFKAAKVETKIDSNAGEVMAVITSMGKRYAYNLKYYSVEVVA